MNRERVLWLGSFVVVAVVAFSIPQGLAQRGSDYSFVRSLMEIHRQVADDYVEPVDEAALRKAAIDGMLSKLDPYTQYIPPPDVVAFNQQMSGKFVGIGVSVDQQPGKPVEIVSPIEGSPALEAGIRSGDLVLQVDGTDVSGMAINDVTSRIKGPAGTKVTLTLRRVTGESINITVARAQVAVPSVRGYNRKSDGQWNYLVDADRKIAYLRITQFTDDTAQEIRQRVEALRAAGVAAVVLDLRFNPGGQLEQATQVCDLFLSSGRIVSTKGRSRPEKVYNARPDGIETAMPMAVLINESSASASEIVAGALADNRRAVVVGARSFGKGSVQEIINLDSDGGELKMTVAYYYLPSGRLLHRAKDAKEWGVEPDHVVPVNLEQQQVLFRAMLDAENYPRPATGPATQPDRPTDPQLQRAISVLRGESPATQPAAPAPPATRAAAADPRPARAAAARPPRQTA